MAKISTYDNASPVTLDDKVIGTSVGGVPTDATKNFLISDLLVLFQGLATKYTADFLVADFVGSVYTLAAATHGRGISPIVQIYDATNRFIRTAGSSLSFATTGVQSPIIGVSFQIVADNAGELGNSISIVLNGVDTIDYWVNQWNIANPTNTATLTYGSGAGYIGSNLETYNLSGGAAAIESIKIETNGDIVVTAGSGGAFDGTIIVM
jgi:hypothetical protein